MANKPLYSTGNKPIYGLLNKPVFGDLIFHDNRISLQFVFAPDYENGNIAYGDYGAFGFTTSTGKGHSAAGTADEMEALFGDEYGLPYVDIDIANANGVGMGNDGTNDYYYVMVRACKLAWVGVASELPPATTTCTIKAWIGTHLISNQQTIGQYRFQNASLDWPNSGHGGTNEWPPYDMFGTTELTATEHHWTVRWTPATSTLEFI
ncbi:MAG: hypothetical protein WC455_30885 [Dehalococcoidia bacterium]|jgi:hypothetical protein